MRERWGRTFRRGTKTSKTWQIRAKGSGQELGEDWAGQGARHWESGTPSLQAGAADRCRAFRQADLGVMGWVARRQMRSKPEDRKEKGESREDRKARRTKGAFSTAPLGPFFRIRGSRGSLFGSFRGAGGPLGPILDHQGVLGTLFLDHLGTRVPTLGPNSVRRDP